MDKNCAINEVDNKNLIFVHQFLIDHKLQNTAETLVTEATSKGFKNFPNASKKDVDYLSFPEQLLLSFKTGDWRTFFSVWNSSIPENVKQTKTYKILTLHLHVYFAMLPRRRMLLHCCNEQDKTQTNAINSLTSLNHHGSEHQENSINEIEKEMYQSMRQLCMFLNSTGKELKDDIELQPFFALPFIEEPNAEPSLSKVFEESWITELTESLLLFLEECQQQNFRVERYTDTSSKKCQSVDQGSVIDDIQKDSVARKISERKNVPIIANDRNIPLFLDDIERNEQYTLSDDAKYTQKSKSVQTVSTISSTEEDLQLSHLASNHKKLVQCTQELAVTKSQLCTVYSNYEKLKRRFHKLHADYHKLMSIARVLTTVLENSVKGQSINFQAMLETCIKIFPDLFNQNIKDNSYCSSEVLIDKSHSEMKMLELSVPCITPVPPKLLNFKKIKLHLINGSIKTKLLLLQALRKKITYGQPGEREEVVHEYISKDLLGLYGQIATYKGISILPYLLTPDNVSMSHPLQQSTTRLLNALASFRCGRDYLSFDSTVIDVVFKCLNSDSNTDTFTCNMIIAVLQKLSLRKQQRIYMIENGLVEWLIHHLHDYYCVMNSYRLEYATALLMNLSLHPIAQKRASTLASLLISTLTDLLLTDHSSTLLYITGALNHFLKNHTINEESKKMEFSSLLEQYNKHKDGEVREHLEHILKIHRGEITIKTDIEDIVDNDSEEFDVVENELEENDPIKSNYGELCGETLLAYCYATVLKTSQDKEMNSETLSYTLVHDNEEQVRSLHYEHTSVSNEQNLSRKNSKITLESSMTLEVGNVTDSRVMDKLSSIASLNVCNDNKVTIDNTSYTQESELDTEDAFQAKPKLPRTPPELILNFSNNFYNKRLDT